MTEIRAAAEDDFAAITRVYAHNVLHGTGTFALEPPSRDEMLARFRQIEAMRLPWLVAVENEEVIGFAYASPFRERPGYKYGVEDSIYIERGVLAEGNAPLVRRAVDLIRQLGERPATTDEARQILEL